MVLPWGCGAFHLCLVREEAMDLPRQHLLLAGTACAPCRVECPDWESVGTACLGVTPTSPDADDAPRGDFRHMPKVALRIQDMTHSHLQPPSNVNCTWLYSLRLCRLSSVHRATCSACQHASRRPWDHADELCRQDRRVDQQARRQKARGLGSLRDGRLSCFFFPTRAVGRCNSTGPALANPGEKNVCAAPSQVFCKKDLPEKCRVIQPGQVITMDYVEDRLNVKVAEDGTVCTVYHG